MTKCYSPQLSRQVVAKLYQRAKSEGIPMTVLASRIIERALGRSETIAVLKPGGNNAESKSK
jgi:hypothetical protein